MGSGLAGRWSGRPGGDDILVDLPSTSSEVFVGLFIRSARTIQDRGNITIGGEGEGGLTHRFLFLGQGAPLSLDSTLTALAVSRPLRELPIPLLTQMLHHPVVFTSPQIRYLAVHVVKHTAAQIGSKTGPNLGSRFSKLVAHLGAPIAEVRVGGLDLQGAERRAIGVQEVKSRRSVAQGVAADV